MSESEPWDLMSQWTRFPGLERIPVAGQAALTFDDGPDPDGTPAVLEALQGEGIRATFFVLGTQLLRHSALAQEALARGHELALHGFDHSGVTELSPDEAAEQVERGVWAYEAVLGHRPRWFRPPFGRMCEGSYAACNAHGLDAVYWSAVGQDWKQISAQEIAANVCARLASGAIVLLHDSRMFAERSSSVPTAEAVKLLAERAGAEGIEFDTIGNLVATAQMPAEGTRSDD